MIVRKTQLHGGCFVAQKHVGQRIYRLKRGIKMPSGKNPTQRHNAATDVQVRVSGQHNSYSGPDDWNAFKAGHGQSTTVLLIDDAPLTRESLSMSLTGCDQGINVLSTTTHHAEAMLRGAFRPNVILVNISSGRGAAALCTQNLIRRLTGDFDNTPVIVLSNQEEMNAVIEAFRLGVRGYIVASAGLSFTLEAIRLVAAGGTLIPSASLGILMKNGPLFSREGVPHTVPADEADGGCVSGLTPREVAVLNCLREGKANKLIAHELGIGESTVKMHVRHILKKLRVNNRTQAVYVAYDFECH